MSRGRRVFQALRQFHGDTMDSEGIKRTNYVTSWFIRQIKVILSSKIIIPSEISDIILLFIGDHFALYSTVYYWYINEELTTKIKNCNIGELFTQKIQIAKTEWTLQLVKNCSFILHTINHLLKF